MCPESGVAGDEAGQVHRTKLEFGFRGVRAQRF